MSSNTQSKATNGESRFWIFASVLLILVFLIMLLPMPRKQSYWHTAEGRSLIQLRTLAQACTVYAGNNNDQLPDVSQWQSLLIAELDMSEDDFVSPAHVDDGESYFLVSNAELFDEDSIMLYENPDHWPDFVNVAYGDSSTDQLSHEEFRRQLEAQQNSSSSGP